MWSNSKEARERLALAKTILAVTLTIPAVVNAAPDADTRVFPEAMQQALQRDLGIKPSDIPRYIEIETRAMRTEAEARRQLGERFGGAWLERDPNGEFRQVIASTGANNASRLGGSEVRRVRHSLASLERVISQLNNAQAKSRLDPAIHSWYVDLPGNSVVVTADPGASASAFVAASGADTSAVRYLTSKARPQVAAGDVFGGSRYNVSGAGGCSVGFAVSHTGSGFITAGHCGPAGTTITDNNNVLMGTLWQSTFPGRDMAWVLMTNDSDWPTRPQVLDYAGSQQNVYGGREAPVGAAVCRSGATSGYRCGVITAKNVTVNYSAGAVYGMAQSNACVARGDSGGSFLTSAGEAQGVTSGGILPNDYENCSESSPVTYYQPLQSLLDSYPGMALKTVRTCGRLNPGQRLTALDPVDSCDGRFRFTMMIEGHLVLTKNFFTIIWSNRVGGSGHRLEMQTDGNMVVYNASGSAVWSSRTAGRNGAALFVQDDGNVVLYSHTGTPIWSTGTAGH